MAISVKRLEGSEIPEDLRGEGVEQVFRVGPLDGKMQYVATEEEAASLAVELSEQEIHGES